MGTRRRDSRAVRVGARVSVAGTTAALRGGGTIGGDDRAERTREATRRIAAALGAGRCWVGARSAHSVVHHRHRPVGGGRARAHRAFFADIRPASSMVQVSALIDPALLVEVEADAVVP